MNNYKCSRCGYSTNHKMTMRRHLTRKNICKPILDDINIQKVFEKYFVNEKIECKHNVNIMSTKCKHNVNILSTLCKQNVNILSTLSKEHCRYCNKEFNTRQSRWRHEKKTCKEKNKKN